MTKHLSYCDLQHLMAKILAATMLDVFPSSKVKTAEASDIGFYADFSFSHIPCEDLLVFLENNMKKFLEKQPKIQVFEMTKANAIEYLLSLQNHQKKDLHSIEKDNTLQAMIQIGSFTDFFPTNQKLSWNDALCHFSLFSMKMIGKNHIRIEGISAWQQEKLQKQRKKCVSYDKWRHEIWGQKLQFFFEDDRKNFIFLPNFLKAKEKFSLFFQKMLQEKGALFIETPKTQNIKEKLIFHQNVWRKLFSSSRKCHFVEKIFYSSSQHNASGLLQFSSQEKFLETMFVPIHLLEKICISYLQFIEKILKIFGFTYDIVVKNICEKDTMHNYVISALEKAHFAFSKEKDKTKEASVCFYIEDMKGRKWEAMYFSIQNLAKEILPTDVKEEEYAMLWGFSCIEVYRLLALLLETKQKKIFPFMEKLSNSNVKEECKF